MFKRLLVAFLIAGLVFATTTASKVHICLNPGSYAFAKKGNDIYRMKVDTTGRVTNVDRIRIFLPGGSPDEHIAVNQCSLYFSWATPGHLPDIWAISPANGWSLRPITRTGKMVEMDPVVEPLRARIAFTQIDEISNVISTLNDGTLPMPIAQGASMPAWQFQTPPSYTELSSGRIVPWGATGQWHTYVPDRSGILVQNGDKFVLWPVTGVPWDFATGIKSVAFGPYNPSGDNLAAIVTTDGGIEFWKLDNHWMPTGTVTPGPGLTGLSYITWIEIK